MIPIDEAIERVRNAVLPLESERVPVGESCGRVLSLAVRSAVDLPPFDQSAVDGWAVRSVDVAAAREGSAATLRRAGEIPAGRSVEGVLLDAGTAVRIFTGGEVPAGADAIARQEIVEESGDRIRLDAPVPGGTDLRRRGEELRAGAEIAPAGVRLTPGLVGAIAAAGVGVVEVARQPRLVILVTGNEVVDAGDPLRSGQVPDANGPLVRAWAHRTGAIAAPPSRIADDRDAVRDALDAAIASGDVVVTTGGVSVGDHDHVHHAARELGVDEVFWKIAQKPGKPLWFGMAGRVPVLGLPGNPGSVLVNLAVYGRIALERLEGDASGSLFSTGVLAEPVKPDTRRDRWVRMRSAVAKDGRVSLHALGHQGSHMLSNLRDADVLARIPAGDAPLPPGTRVPVVRL